MNLKQLAEKHGDAFISVVEEQLKLLASEQPDFRYNTSGDVVSCSYSEGASRYSTTKERAEPAGPECSGCVFGQALARLGWDDETEKKSNKTIDQLMEDFAEIEVPLYWNKVQSGQDYGTTWKEAVDRIPSQQPIES